jgi:hypothetical protein
VQASLENVAKIKTFQSKKGSTAQDSLRADGCAWTLRRILAIGAH